MVYPSNPILTRVAGTFLTFIKTFLIVFYCASQIELQLVFGPSNSLSTQLQDSSIVFLYCMSFLPELINTLFLPEFQKKLFVKPGWSSPPVA